MQHPLDDPIWSALSGPNARFAIGFGKALHFQRDVAPFSAISEPSDEAYADLAVQLPAGGLARMFRPAMEPLPVGWEHVEDFSLLQMVAVPQVLKRATGSSEISVLKAQDLPEMLELVSLTQPGPFEERTPELGLYLGIRQGGRLIAMAGERMRVPGYVELSAVCTLPQARGRGLAALLLRRLMQGAFERGETPFLHVVPTNIAAVSLYEKLGFVARKQLHVLRRRPFSPSRE
ncbi:MAG TPA: GNAT family N-acetyltransferase [Ramlibacter sp.]|nr:GNAT family N-acetyltransferase [Ramlibacter sp.]